MNENEIEKMEVRWPSCVEIKITYAVQYKSKRAKKWVNYYSESKWNDLKRVKELAAQYPKLMFRQVRFETVKTETEITE